MSIVSRARPEIRALAPYSSARMEASGGSVMLNANESPWDGTGLNRYPDPQPGALVAALARRYGAAPEQVLAGRGSDEAIDLLVRAFCAAGSDAIVICPPTFAMYGVCARIQGAQVIEVPLTGAAFDVDADVLLASITSQVKLVFLCAPNNPTGGSLPLATIARIAAALRDRALVVVDEAYIEFAQAPSAVSLLGEHGNVAVLRTLSKAYALASARVGAVIAAAEIVELLRRIQAPYPLPAPSVHAALRVLDPERERDMADVITRTIQAREQLREQLTELPAVQAVLPSCANFLCVKLDDAAAVYRRLLRRGVVVRDVSRYPGLAGHLRISVGTPDDNARLLAALRAPEAAQ